MAACLLCHAKNSLLPVRLTFLGWALHPEEKLAFQIATTWPAQMFSFRRCAGGYSGQKAAGAQADLPMCLFSLPRGTLVTASFSGQHGNF